MANPDQKTILIEQAYKDIKEICWELQNSSGFSDKEIKNLLIELTSLWGREEDKKNLYSDKIKVLFKTQ